MKWMFKEDNLLEHRCVESSKIRAKYPYHVPVIMGKVSGSHTVDTDRRKYLVPSDITVAQFMWIIRKRIQLPSEKAIFLFVDKTVPQSSLTLGDSFTRRKKTKMDSWMCLTAERTLLTSEALAGLGAPFLLVYLVNYWLFSVIPQNLHTDLLMHL